MDRIEFFKTHARSLFSVLESEYQYDFEEEKVFRHADIDWSIKLIYINEVKNLRIEIEQAPYYTDYGFTFSVQNIDSKEDVIIYNLAHERQDSENNFLENAFELIFSNKEAIELISGKEWQTYSKILIQG
jgi:hypothetical protein